MSPFRRSASVLVFAAILTGSSIAPAQAPHQLTDAEKQKIETIVHGMTLDQKLEYIGGTGFAVRAVPSAKLPALEMSDGPYGTRSNAGFPSTTYAAGIGLAASWDRELAARVGAGIGRDARARGVHFMLGPGVNIYRSPRNGRNFEYFGEDPFLTSAIAVGYITGMQQQGVSATIKHFLGNNSEFLRHDSDSVIDERSLREIYLPSFEAGVKQAHVGAIMDSYNLINGHHATENGTFNTDIVRKEWGFAGTMMSDWDATYDGVAAANGGLDLEMPSGKFMNKADLAPAIKAGTVSEATIDEKIRHILTTAMEFGWLDRPGAAGRELDVPQTGSQTGLPTEPKVNSQTDLALSVDDASNNATALRSARESAVLLKNTRNVLPLNKSQIKTLLVVGPDAYPGVPVGGGSAGVVPFHLVSSVEGLVTHAGDSGMTVLYDRGLPTMADLALATSFTTRDGKPGLTFEEFSDDTLSGSPIKTSVAQHVISSGVTIESLIDNPEIMAALLSGSGLMTDKKSSRRWSGTYTAAADGDYILAIEGSGEGSGNRVSLDGKQVFENWDLVRAFQPAVTLHLAAGAHTLLVEDKQGGLFSGHIRFGIVAADKVVSARAKELAARADAVVVAAGFDHASESEGGDRTFALPFGQDQLIEAMAAANKKTIVTITSGGNVDSEAWLSKVPAVLETWYAGQSGGTALAEILFGDVNPGGHLPATFERRAEDNPTFNNYYPDPGTKEVHYKEGLFVGYRGYEHTHAKPLFPFGYGLSYTSFAFSGLKVSPESAGANPKITVSFNVKNTGARKGAEVAQVYVSDDHLKAPHAERQLKGFERVELAPGESRAVSVTLDARAFAWYDVAAKKWTIDPGKFTIHVGDNLESTPLHGSVTLAKEAAGSTF